MELLDLIGMHKASEFARRGQFIFAIKHLEKVNPGISRAQAKAAVEALGYSDAGSDQRKRPSLERVL